MGLYSNPWGEPIERAREGRVTETTVHNKKRKKTRETLRVPCVGRAGKKENPSGAKVPDLTILKGYGKKRGGSCDEVIRPDSRNKEGRGVRRENSTKQLKVGPIVSTSAGRGVT